MSVIARCPWAKTDLSIAYHDTEWGVPVHDDRLLFEFLVLEGAQAGLSWETILRKREAYRTAFDNFEIQAVAKYGARKVEQLLANPGIVRNRLKIAAATTNARAGLAVQKKLGSLDAHLCPSSADGAHQSLAFAGPRPGADGRGRGHEPGPSQTRIPLRRPHHLLRLHAGGRDGERPPRLLLPPRRSRPPSLTPAIRQLESAKDTEGGEPALATRQVRPIPVRKGHSD